MPGYVVDELAEAVDRNGKPFARSAILILRVAYKKNVGDMREARP